MSDNEEPSAKHFKLQSRSQDQEDELEEGQEEWLSEDVLSEEEYYQTVDQEQSDYAIMNQDDTMTSAQDYAENSNVYHDTGDSNAQDGHERYQDENIEQTLNNLENSQDKDFPDELGAFLIRKTDGMTVKKEAEDRESEVESAKHSDDDGHDTDELLRMLGEDEAKRKKKPGTGIKLVKTEPREGSSDDDDDFIFGTTKVTRVKVAKDAFIKKYARKAVAEDLSDKEDSVLSDEVATMKNMFVTRRPGPRRHVAAKSTTIGGINALQTVTKRVVSLDGKTNKRPMPPTSHRQVILKQVSKEEPKRERQRYKQEPEEIINEEEFLDEEEFDLDEDMETDDEADDSSNRQRSRQRIMRPERMDEEVPSDGDSQSDESFYDEMPSSESEDLDEWFTLDIRAERAGDYLPLLGSKAKQLLINERNRVGARLATLDQSLLALRESGRQQSEQLRRATAALAELDAALRTL